MVVKFISFAVLVAPFVLLPGIDFAQIMRAATQGGPKRAYQTLFGLILGVFFWGIIAALGISVLTNASESAYKVLKYGGAIYLFYLGLKMLFLKGKPLVQSSATSTFLRGFMITVTNPKNGAFYLAVMPQFLPSEISPLLGGFIISLIHNVECFIWFSAVIWSTNLVRKYIQRENVQKTIERISGIALIGFGLKVISER